MRRRRAISIRSMLPAFALMASIAASAQGVFLFANSTARTHIESAEGPLAGTNILGQMLAAPLPDSLQPIGTPLPHFNGGIFSCCVAVPGIPVGELAYLQMVAWDSALWGNSLSGVPADQVGRTDIVTMLLGTGEFPDPLPAPRFTQSAIVPIPEPSVLALGVMVAGIFGLRWRRP